MTLTEWLSANLPIIEERMKTPVRATKGGQDETIAFDCRYRVNGIAEDMSPENCCFIGMTISPENYRAMSPEGQNADDVIAFTDEVHIYDVNEEICIRDLQAIHDTFLPDTWQSAYTAWRETYAEFLP